MSYRVDGDAADGVETYYATNGDKLYISTAVNEELGANPIATFTDSEEKQFTSELIQHDYSILKNQELDIVIPELKLAIEFNGSFWHNSDVKDRFYHYRKTQKCLQKGYRLIHIWEDEWDSNLVQNKLKNILIQSEIFPILYDNFILDLSWFSPIETKDYNIQFKYQKRLQTYKVIKELH